MNATIKPEFLKGRDHLGEKSIDGTALNWV
jgi:hypothetical protein